MSAEPLDVHEPLAEALGMREASAIKRVSSDPVSRLALRQVLDAAENFSDGCAKRNLIGGALDNWEEDRSWLILEEEEDRPFSLEWCCETIWVRTRFKLNPQAVREWARSKDPGTRRRGRRAPAIVPRVGRPGGEMASSA